MARNTPIGAGVSRHLKEHLEQKARERGLSLSSFVRQILIEATGYRAPDKNE